MNCVTDRNIDVMATGLDARGTPASEGSISKIFSAKRRRQPVYQIKRRKLCQAFAGTSAAAGENIVLHRRNL
jgi:hypothetical protein